MAKITIPATGSGDATPDVQVDKVGQAQTDTSGASVQVVEVAGVSAGGTVTRVGASASGLKVDGSAVTQPVSGTVSLTGSVAVSVGNPTVFVSSFPSTQPVSGTVTANAGTGPFNVASQSGLAVQVAGGVALTSTATVTGTVAATQSGTWNTNVASQSGVQVQISGPVALASTATVQGTVAATQSGQWTSTLAAGSIQTVTGNVAIASTVTVQGTVAATQSGAWNVAPVGGSIQTVTGNVALASTATVTGTVTANQGGAPWAVTTSPAGGAIQSITGIVAISSNAPMNLNQVGSVSVPSNGAAINRFGISVMGTDQGTQGAHIVLTDVQGAQILGGADGVFLSSVVTVGVTATALPATTLANRKALAVLSESSNTGTVYLGGSGVTSSTGFILAPGQSQPFQAGLATLYGIASIAGQKVRVEELS